MNYKHGCTIVENRNQENPKWKAYVCWLSMKKRCNNPDKKDFDNYKGRGISYDQRWNDFTIFLNDMGLPPKGTSIERIDNSGDYCKENCKWATRKEQMRNTRHNKYLEYQGKKMMICEWAEHLGLKSVLLRVRLGRGWSVERTLSTPYQPLGTNQYSKVLTIA